jgi:hypothetical protein
MGNYAITIEGIGQHHNGGDPSDADIIAAAIVLEMRKRGHKILHATITYGAAQDVTALAEVCSDYMTCMDPKPEKPPGG